MDDRAWMYTGWKCVGQLSGEWIDKTEAFLDGAFAKLKGGNTTWCPCNKCANTHRQTREVMTNHLCNYGDRLIDTASTPTLAQIRARTTSSSPAIRPRQSTTEIQMEALKVISVTAKVY